LRERNLDTIIKVFIGINFLSWYWCWCTEGSWKCIRPKNYRNIVTCAQHPNPVSLCNSHMRARWFFHILNGFYLQIIPEISYLITELQWRELMRSLFHAFIYINAYLCWRLTYSFLHVLLRSFGLLILNDIHLFICSTHIWGPPRFMRCVKMKTNTAIIIIYYIQTSSQRLV